MDERSNDAGGGVSPGAGPGPEPAPLSPPIPLAPPTTPGPLRIPDRPKVWPTAVGVIAIVFGVLGFLSSVWGVIGPFLMEAVLQFAPAAAESMQGATEFAPYLAALSGCGALLAVLLTVGGIGLVKRRPWAPRTIRWWSWLRILLVVALSAGQYFMQSAMFERATAAGSPSGGASGGSYGGASGGAAGGGPVVVVDAFGTAALLVGVVLGIVWGWALPIFMLIWFGRPKVRAEIASWRTRARA